MAENIVNVDMDGVLANFDKEVTRRMRKLNPDFEEPDPSTDFYYHNRVSPDQLELVKQIQSQRGFFASFEPIDHALGGWQRLKDLGYEPRICSSPLRSNETCVQEKYSWVKKYLGKKAAETAIFDKNKSRPEYAALALIDDRPEVMTGLWQQIVFSRPCNEEFANRKRLPIIRGWLDPNLADILEVCRSRNI